MAALTVPLSKGLPAKWYAHMVRSHFWIIGHYLQKRNITMTKNPGDASVEADAVETVTRRAGAGEELVNA